MTAAGSTQTLLLTATIAPREGVHLLARRDPESRRAEYLAAYELYAEMVARHPSYRVVFVENSGSDLKEFGDIATRLSIGDRAEFVSYTSDDPPGFSRLYLEGALIRHGLEASRILAEAGTTIWKVTGRYKIANLDRLIERAPERFDIYVNLRDHPSKALDFYVAGFSRNGLDAVLSRLEGRLAVVRTGEDIFREAIEQGDFDDLEVVKRYNTVPWITGTRGHDGRSYHGIMQTLKYGALVATNSIAPRLWI